MKRALGTVAALFAIMAALLTTTTPAQALVDRDCGDFATQAAAQAFFNAAGPGDPHRLDSEGDGIACESNPCPCSTGGGQQPPPSTGGDSTGGSGSAGGSGGQAVVKRNVGNVVKVTDGDTLKVRIRGVGIRDVRLIGIDTPEKYGQRECGAVKATDSMHRWAPVGSSVVLFSDPSQADRDRYDRLLRYVERKGRDVGRAQVFTGHAQVYVYNNDPFRRTADYRRVERQAKAQGRSLWSECWH
ncbi:hypothetical protein DDE18_21165 [Nocardioides gansuensis]|uniref:TNase-like domain-containing protein n=1 Tax=Nocardioides gansuensis TaxID=2138300 RepID=A0A2T8F4Y3_9ACTN|nr:thermonuclease family protein [Nocardioides gansuensis]PVG80764.1 hypothetical protein DDE18_21165 [Nocardioides gansuensis]